MKYFKNKTWSQITREERLFCAELFFEMKKDIKPFLKLIGKENREYEISYESCFYRDVLHAYGLSIEKTDLPQKRTFDLALFSDEAIIIIEAKAKQGFDNDQLDSFEADFRNIRKLFGIIGEDMPKLEIIALCSSNYTPKDSTLNKFSKVIRWNELAEIYPKTEDLFLRANSVYND